MKRILFFLLLLVNLQLTTDNGSLSIGFGEVSAQRMGADVYQGFDSGLTYYCKNCDCMIPAYMFDDHLKHCEGFPELICANCGRSTEDCACVGLICSNCGFPAETCECKFVCIGSYNKSGGTSLNYAIIEEPTIPNIRTDNILEELMKDDRNRGGSGGGNWGNNRNGNQADRNRDGRGRDDYYDRDRTDSEMLCEFCLLPMRFCICSENVGYDDRGGGSTGSTGDSKNNKSSQVEQELASTGKEIFTKMEADLTKGNFKTVKVSIVDEGSVDAQKAKVLSTISNSCLVPGTIDATVGAMQYFKYGTAIANNPFYAGIAKTFGIFGIPVAMGQTILICAEKGSWGNMTLGEQLTIISGGLCAVGVCLDCAAVVFPPLAAVGTGCQIIGVGLGIASFFVSDVPILIPLENGKYLLMTPVYDIS